MTTIRSSFAATIIFTCFLLGCDADSKSRSAAFQTTSESTIATTFYPTTWLTKQIVGAACEVKCPLPQGEDPIAWMPSDADIQAYQSASLIVVNGAAYEKWLDRVSLPASRVVDTTDSLTEPFLQYEVITHQHGPRGEYSLEGVDGHTWLDPLIAKQQASRIAEACSEQWPEHASEFASNLSKLNSRLEALHQQLGEIDVSQAVLLSSHPSCNYIARRYGWKVGDQDISPEGPISDETIKQVKALAVAGKRTVLLWNSEPAAEISKRLWEECRVISIVFSACEVAPESGDYATVMNANIERLKKSLVTEQK